MHIWISSCEKNRNEQSYLSFATADECHHPLKPTYNRTSKKNLQSLSQAWTTLFLEVKVASFKINGAFCTLQLNTGNGKKFFGKQHQPWAIHVFGRLCNTCLCWDLAFFLSYLLRAAWYFIFFIPAHSHFCFSLLHCCSVLCWRLGKKVMILPTMKPLDVCSLYLPFLLSSLFLMISCSHVTSVSKACSAPWDPHLSLIMLLIVLIYFKHIMVMQVFLQLFCRKFPLDIHSWKLFVSW